MNEYLTNTRSSAEQSLRRWKNNSGEFKIATVTAGVFGCQTVQEMLPALESLAGESFGGVSIETIPALEKVRESVVHGLGAQGNTFNVYFQCKEHPMEMEDGVEIHFLDEKHISVKIRD